MLEDPKCLMLNKKLRCFEADHECIYLGSVLEKHTCTYHLKVNLAHCKPCKSAIYSHRLVLSQILYQLESTIVTGFIFKTTYKYMYS